MRTIRNLNILVALSCEAKPLVDYYRLTKKVTTGFSYFSRAADQKFPFNIHLVVSGLGARNMAAACGWLGANSKKNNCVWLNVGVAGHKEYQLGEIVRINKASEMGSAKSFYPALVAKWPDMSTALISYPEVCTDYPVNAAVDMEGYAFFEVAIKFSSAELVQSLKIISDNSRNGIEVINAASVSGLIADKIETINSFSKKLLDLLRPPTPLPKTLMDIQHLHTTVSQLQQYNDLVEKLINLGVVSSDIKKKLSAASSMKELLIELRLVQQQTAPVLKFSAQVV